MELSDFSVKDLCRIIEVCHKNGVSKLALGDLALEFSENEPETLPQEYINPVFGPNDTPVEAGGKDRIEDEGLLEEARYSQLMIDDPVAFEQEMIDGMLRDERREQMNA